MTITQPHPLEVKARPFIEVSDSQIKLFQTCPRSWAYQKLLKIFPDEDKWNLYFGSGVHGGLEVLHNGDYLQAAKQKAIEVCAKDAPDDVEMQEKAAAIIEGYGKYFYPVYQQNWKTEASEEWYEYFPHPQVKMRGSRDNVSSARIDPSYWGIFDFKTTGFKDGGALGQTIPTNHQLAIYGISKCREVNQWPKEMGLIFLQKPRTKNHKDWIRNALSDPTLYSMKAEPFTPAMANYALAVEQEIIGTGLQMLALARIYDLHGTAALDSALPNFNSCFAYGRMCGFAQGCHNNRPLHKEMK